jgi:hypothetical protein
MALDRSGIDNAQMPTTQRQLRDRLAAVPFALETAARGASPEPPAPGEWTPSEIVRHLIAVEDEVWQPRLRQVATEDHPSWPWVEPEPWPGDPGAPLEQLLATYRALRSSTMAMLDALGEAGWARWGTHATYGRLDVAGLMTKAIVHDDEHLRSLDHH